MPVPRRMRLLIFATILTVFVVYNFILPSKTPYFDPLSTTTTSSDDTPSDKIPAAAKPPQKFKSGNSFDWSTFDPYYPPGSIKSLPEGKPRALPPVQAPASAFKSSSQNDKRREKVRQAFKKSWDNYKKHAWMQDELAPLSGTGKKTFGGWAATLVDALDTLWIMDFKEDFHEAVLAAGTIDWSKTTDGAANLFETTIRHLGGLLSAYDISGGTEPLLLQKAHELGEMLYVGFDTPNRLPGFWLNFDDARNGKQTAGTHDPSASPASLSLEFTRLSQLTHDPKFYDATDRVYRFLEKTQNTTQLPGMWPIAMNFRDEKADDADFTLGALADSLYEYLPKMHALLGGTDPAFETMYKTAMDAVVKNLVFRPMTPNDDDVLFTGDARVHKGQISLTPDSQHLSCFTGGMFGLGSKLFEIPTHLEKAQRLALGCGWAYTSSPHGIMPEIFTLMPCESLTDCKWDEVRWTAEAQKAGSKTLPKGFKDARDARYILRPEAIESIFLLYRMTGGEEWRELAWAMFEKVMEATETEYGNAAIQDVMAETLVKVDSMESFWMAETLKYYYLIFSPPDLVSLDEFVLNTEAHPLRRPKVEPEAVLEEAPAAV